MGIGAMFKLGEQKLGRMFMCVGTMPVVIRVMPARSV